MKMKNLGLLGLILSLLGCQSDAPQYLAEIEFEDEFIKNCVYQMRWVYDYDTGTMEHKHHISSTDTYYVDARDIPISAVTELDDCHSYNQDEYGDSVLDSAAHLKDLRHFPNLSKITLNFTLEDASYLNELDQVEYLTLDKTAYSDGAPLRELSQITGMTGLRSLYLRNWQFDDWRGLGDFTNLTSLAISNYSNDVSFSGIRYLSEKTVKLGLYGLYFENEEDVRLATHLVGLGLEPIFRYNSVNPEAEQFDSPSNFDYLTALTNLEQVNISNTNIADLSVLGSNKFKFIGLDMEAGDFDSEDVRQLARFKHLRAISIELRSNQWLNDRFDISYHDSSKDVMPIDKPVDSSYAYLTIKDEAYSRIAGLVNLEPSTDFLSEYLAKDLSQQQIMALLTEWLAGNLKTVLN